MGLPDEIRAARASRENPSCKSPTTDPSGPSHLRPPPFPFFSITRQALREDPDNAEAAASLAAAEDKYNAALVRRHAGVLGYAAIVRAFPYTVPDWMAEVVVTLARFATDPQPVKRSVQQCFSDFWRTQGDNWHATKQVFTSDQISDLTELLASPSYFS